MNYMYVGVGSFVAGAVVSYLYAKSVVAAAVKELENLKGDLYDLNGKLQAAVVNLSKKV